ncbi:MAG: hypothetical protein IJV39_06595 [Ruminococcus sp.]|nr:hypothetical protein [Ruminococcus sp.]
MNKTNNNEKLILNKYHLYDVLIVCGLAAVVLGLLFFITVFTGTLTLGRASVIISLFLIVLGSISITCGRILKKDALGEVDDFYEDYLTPAREKRIAKRLKKTENSKK